MKFTFEESDIVPGRNVMLDGEICRIIRVDGEYSALRLMTDEAIKPRPATDMAHMLNMLEARPILSLAHDSVGIK